jgi:adenylate cyclase class IV
MRNVEFKSELRDLEAARQQCRQIGALHEATLRQTDTYVRMAEGRLKRRETVGAPTEWIYYRRPDGAQARVAEYTILSDEQARIRFGVGTLTPWKVVRKTRELWALGSVRIHLDRIEGVGTFIEFEAVISPRHDVAESRTMVQHLREEFAPILGEALAGSYEALVAELPEPDRAPPLP